MSKVRKPPMPKQQAEFFSDLMDLSSIALKTDCTCEGCQALKKFCAKFLASFKDAFKEPQQD